MDQVSLRLIRPDQTLDMEAVRRQPTMTRAIVLCADLAGFASEKDFCRQLEIDPAVWARIKGGDANFPHDRFEELFSLCGNDAPLFWLADRRGFVLSPKESELERRLRGERQAREEAEKKVALLTDILKGRT